MYWEIRNSESAFQQLYLSEDNAARRAATKLKN